MDGVGSTRLGRASARYGSTAVFNGPVRKWKKKWVHVSPSSAVKHSQSNGNNSNGNSSSSAGAGAGATSIVLCRWTPLSSTDFGSSVTASAVDGEDEEQPPKRKFRYTPVAVLEEERKRAAAKQVEDEAKTDENETNQSPDWLSSKTNHELNMNKDLKKGSQDSSMGNLDLGLCLKGHDDRRVSVGEKEGQEKAASSAGFWTMG
ncbi:PREDICTED: uncharacterized protein LOC18593424 [Theobroma cacao]|uniref:Uncharacterized protein LOC18593424 n=1 Tax=Theobroma cacao TaxID=3641 RepID=A0AB32UXR1_THECC|nr:PREDICTED: uncharacterized protein LOC18593424 [Theobroma cacao]